MLPMRSGQILGLTLLAIGLAATLLATGGYALYLRSDAYRESCAAVLSDRLGLPSEIGRVVPRSRAARDFEDIRVWLPERRGMAAVCERATLAYRPRTQDPDAYDIDLVGGRVELSTRTWLRGDYRSVLESGLKPGFAPDGPHRVTFRNMHVALDADGLQAALRDASGQVDFVGQDEGHAALVCYTLNDHQSTRPVTLKIDFSPRASGVQLDHVEMVVPELPLAALDLSRLAGLTLQSGAFSGRMSYEEHAGETVLTASGRLGNLDLAELTAGFLPTPWRGRAPELQLDELIVRRGRAESIRFHGQLQDVAIGDVLAPWGLQDAGGALRINVRTAELSPGGIDQLILSAQCDALALESLSRAVGWGQVTGTARLVVSDLTIAGNHLASLNAEIRVPPPAEDGQPAGTIASSVLAEAVRRAFQFQLPPLLPSQIEYSNLGVRLEARDELLNVFGTHGPGGKIILTIRIGGQNVPVVPEPAQPFDLRPQLDILRAQLAAQLAPPSPPPVGIDPWITWLKSRWPPAFPPPPATQPEAP